MWLYHNYDGNYDIEKQLQFISVRARRNEFDWSLASGSESNRSRWHFIVFFAHIFSHSLTARCRRSERIFFTRRRRRHRFCAIRRRRKSHMSAECENCLHENHLVAREWVALHENLNSTHESREKIDSIDSTATSQCFKCDVIVFRDTPFHIFFLTQVVVCRFSLILFAGISSCCRHRHFLPIIISQLP